MMRPSCAGPVLPPEPPWRSASRGSVLLWMTPPTDMMFFAQACGRLGVLPEFDWLWRMVMLWSKRMSSISAETVV